MWVYVDERDVKLRTKVPTYTPGTSRYAALPTRWNDNIEIRVRSLEDKLYVVGPRDVEQRPLKSKSTLWELRRTLA